ncbi:MAG: hypothetical protein JWO28_3337 [Hyphomicrobiales bacterium]|nr:hypothetical protein [Hyphomicrobiales bacterium]
MAPTRGGARLARRGQTSSLDPWRRSARFRRIALENCRANNVKAKAASRCGAKRKRDGQPCEKPALKGRTRCRQHGGGTPSGSQWHTVVWPDDSTPAGVVKFQRKLRQQQKFAAERAARRAKMTEEELARHLAWHRSHRPGPGAARAAQRELTRQNADARATIAVRPSEPVSGVELTHVMANLAAAKARLAELEAQEAIRIDDQGDSHEH